MPGLTCLYLYVMAITHRCISLKGTPMTCQWFRRWVTVFALALGALSPSNAADGDIVKICV